MEQAVEKRSGREHDAPAEQLVAELIGYAGYFFAIHNKGCHFTLKNIDDLIGLKIKEVKVATNFRGGRIVYEVEGHKNCANFD